MVLANELLGNAMNGYKSVDKLRSLAMPGIIITSLLVMLSLRCSWGQDFRIETEVYFDDEKEPISENLTLFSRGRVYDFMLTGTQEVVVFDPARQEFHLLDVVHKHKLTLSSEAVKDIISAQQMSDMKKQEPFFFRPRFDVSFDSDTLWLTLSSDRVTYRAQGVVPDESGHAEQYRLFADAYARLNYTVPGRMPPFARLELNKELATRKLIPQRVELTINTRKRPWPKNVQITSRHLLIWQLSKTDRKRIEKAGYDLVNFRQVSFKEYRRLNDGQLAHSPSSD